MFASLMAVVEGKQIIFIPISYSLFVFGTLKISINLVDYTVLFFSCSDESYIIFDKLLLGIVIFRVMKSFYRSYSLSKIKGNL